MPHIPPRTPSRGGEEHDGSDFKTVLGSEKEGDITLSAPSVPDRGLFGEPTMEPTRTIFQQEHGYPSSLSDASEESSGSHSCFDDDEPEHTDPTAVAAEGESEREISVNDDGVDTDDADDSEFSDCIDDSDNDNVETTDNFKNNEAGMASLRFLTEGRFHGDIAVVITYAFVGKPKMVHIPHSPRSTNDSRRWGKSVSSTPGILDIQTPSLGNDGSDSSSDSETSNSNSETSTSETSSSEISNSEIQTTALGRSGTTTPPNEVEPLFPVQPPCTSTTICYSDASTTTNKSAWRGLVYSVSRRKRQIPRKRPENIALGEEGRSDKLRPPRRKFPSKLSMSAKS